MKRSLTLGLRHAASSKKRGRAVTYRKLPVAHRIGSSQSRVVKAEAGMQEIPVELIIRATVASGATAQEIGEAIQATVAVPA